jgi:hypothetical protein
MMSLRLLIPFVAVVLAVTIPAASAQQRQPRAQAGRLAPAEVQGLFDAYTLMQAQESLKLSDAQYAQFVTRLKALQDTRRRNQQARARLLRELAREANAGAEGPLRDRLGALREHDVKSAEELRRAYTAVDEVLDVRQQARFRLFEERMEERKFELLMRARQRPANRGRPPSP